ncbi:MAG: coenzyme F420-0:L-glutamate ligase [Candidatus Bathyarchaeota archaeon]|nr:coenzyme F420-0:L-glutamate ligase [Candidatus Bathyarchaeota archaeon]MDH5786871.1 coenzyme F420-0:L-glutamate ligase [Candidatus Bathyarchaeota archaeon]
MKEKNQTKLNGGDYLKTFTVNALEDFPLIESENDIGRMIVKISRKEGLKLEDGDVIVIAQKIFSKAEKRIAGLKDVVPSEKAEIIAKTIGKSRKFVELVLRETKNIVKVSKEVLLVEDKRGLVCINAGIDKSNVKGRDNFTLLPENPDESARKCRVTIKKLTSKNVAVIICDTYSRPFRRGQVNFAIGASGINPFKDYRGKKDLFGQTLKVKNVAVVDEIAAAAELLMGQATEARPVVIIKGLNDVVDVHEKSSINELYISKEEDLFKDTL